MIRYVFGPIYSYWQDLPPKQKCDKSVTSTQCANVNYALDMISQPMEGSTMESHPSFDEFDEINSPRPAATAFEGLAEKSLSRRGFLGALGAAGVAAGTTALTPLKANASSRLGFKPVAANTLDTVTLPPGYSWKPLVRWGDPLWSEGPEFDPLTRSSGAAQELQFGDNNDGMEMFTRDSRTVLVANNEYTNRYITYGANPSKQPETSDDVRKAKAAHGVSIFQIRDGSNGWQIVLDAPENRLITADAAHWPCPRQRSA